MIQIYFFLMTLLIIGDEQALNESRLKFGATHQYLHVVSSERFSDLPSADVVFDFYPSVARYADAQLTTTSWKAIFVNSIVRPLHTLVLPLSNDAPLIIGFNGLPTFVDRKVLEVTLLSREDESRLKEVCGLLGTDFALVKDRPGMVTARVVSMIINEAYLTLEEGTATREDIDKAMKLGTNYPFGPFEWAERIGLPNVVAVLQAVKESEGAERFPICSLLMQQARSTY